MKNMLKVLWMLILCLCVGTMVAQLLLAAVLWPKIALNRERIAQIVAIAQGADWSPREDPKGPALLESEQASYQDVVEARAVKYRNLELREQQLRNNLVQVQSEESKLADDTKRFKQLSDNFNAQLKEVRDSSTSSGMDEVMRILASGKPKQAKELLLDMLDKKEIDAAVVLIKQLPEKKRANILGEFKTDDEKEQLSEVLRRIREGQPEMKAVEKVQAKPEAKSPS